MSFLELKDVFELLAYIVTIFGFPIAIYIFYYEREKEHEETAKQALAQSSDRYVAFLELSLNFPKLDIFSTPIVEEYILSEDETRIESSLIAMLVDMFEKAYLMYHDDGKCIHPAQWNGWVETIKSYCYRNNFKREWNLIGIQYDPFFYQFMQNTINLKKIEI